MTTEKEFHPAREETHEIKKILTQLLTQLTPEWCGLVD